MINDNHTKAVGALHIACALITLLVIAAVALFFGALTAVIDKTDIYHFFATLGGLIALPFVALAVGQIIAAVYLMQGSRTARGFIMAFGILHLVNLPLGTALGVYTLWALLRPEPAAALPPV